MVMEMERSFEVNTPLGKLKVYAKQEDDASENFPGVYIDLIPADSNDAITPNLRRVRVHKSR